MRLDERESTACKAVDHVFTRARAKNKKNISSVCSITCFYRIFVVCRPKKWSLVKLVISCNSWR